MILRCDYPGLSTKFKYPYKRHTKRDTKRERESHKNKKLEIGVVQLQTKECPKSLKAGRRKEMNPP